MSRAAAWTIVTVLCLASFMAGICFTAGTLDLPYPDFWNASCK